MPTEAELQQQMTDAAKKLETVHNQIRGLVEEQNKQQYLFISAFNELVDARAELFSPDAFEPPPLDAVDGRPVKTP